MRKIRNFIRDAYSINNALTASALCKKIENELGYEVKLTMLKKFRQELGFVWKSTKCGHLIRPANKEKQLQFCTRILEIKESFPECIFLDESTTQLNLNSKIYFVEKDDAIGRRRSVAKYPLKVHVWACISYRRATNICIWDEKMDSTLYCKIINEFYLLFAQAVYQDRCHLVQNNDPIHKSLYTLKKFEESKIRCLDWPPESTDLNPIEKVWHQLKQYLRMEYNPSSKSYCMKPSLIFFHCQYEITKYTVAA
uniref:DDE_3 domain-containing protein n=1 Tax=Heterorhabditis bacteriophora TaxID=37862 RepID=A0A1I7WLE8_HETBA